MSISRDTGETPSDLIIETLLAETLERARFGVFVYDDEGRYIAVNARGAALLGLTRDEVMKHNVGDFTAGGIDRETLLSRKVTTGTRTIRRPDGSEVRLAFVVAPSDLGGHLPHRVAIAWEPAANDATV